MRIDAHHHVWRRDDFVYPWMNPSLEPLLRDFEWHDLEPHLQQHFFDATVLVQTISDVDETRWFLRLANEITMIAGVVGWVDLTKPDVADQLDEFKSLSKHLVGVRHQVHDETDENWLLREPVRRGLEQVSRRGLCYDLLVRPEHLPAATAIAREFEQLPLVLDHIAKPDIAKGRGFDAWAEGITQLAACPNVSCKLSGMVTEADWKTWCPADLKKYIDHIISAFGTHRTMFGSDWPVCLLAGDYAEVVNALEQNLLSYSPSERARIFGENASRIYHLESFI